MTDTTTDQGDERRAFETLWELYARVGDAHENHGRNHEKTVEARATFHAALKRALSASQPVAQEAICPRCEGSGDQQYMTQHLGPDDYDVTGPCSECGGSGAVAVGAFNCPICGKDTPHHHSDFEQVQAMSEEQIDAELRAQGIDPEAASQKVQQVIKECFDEYDRQLKNPLAASQAPQVEGILRKDAAHQLACIARKYGSTSTHDRAGLMAAMRDAYLLGQQSPTPHHPAIAEAGKGVEVSEGAALRLWHSIPPTGSLAKSLVQFLDLAASQEAVTQDGWPDYIAGIIETYLSKGDAPDDKRTAAIAGIIRRRMYLYPKPDAPSESTAVSGEVSGREYAAFLKREFGEGMGQDRSSFSIGNVSRAFGAGWEAAVLALAGSGGKA